MIDSTIAHYRITAKIGEGGMGEVYQATDTRLHRDVALKILPESFANDPERLARFRREAQALAALNHPNICAIYDIGETDGRPYLVMELLQGTTLEESLCGPALSEAQALEIMKQLAGALEAAHQRGIIHRDIKPANIHLTSSGQAKVLDFGLAKTSFLPDDDKTAEAMTQAGAPIGTISYMSPEQALGQTSDHRSDLFSLGVVFYRMLADRLPFEGDSPLARLNSIIHDSPPGLRSIAPDVSPGLCDLVDHLLAKEPDSRPRDAVTLIRQLDSLQAESSSPALRSAAPNSIAVLPFTNMSADAANEYFGDGLAEELINALTAVEGLQVAARTSAFNYKGSDKSVPEIGRDLGVETVLEGSVRQSGDRIRITAQLINVADGYHLWSERYDRQMRDIFDVQDEITGEIVETLQVQLGAGARAAVVRRHTENPEAYNLFLKGRYYWAKRSSGDLQRALRTFEEAVRLDPHYALPYIGIAESYFVLSSYMFIDPEEGMEKARRAARKSVQLNPDLPGGHRCLSGIATWWDRDFEAADAHHARAIALNPDNPLTVVYRAMGLAVRERVKEASELAVRAAELEPTPMILSLCGLTFNILRDYKAASAVTAEALKAEPGNFAAQWALAFARLFGEGAEAALPYFVRATFLSHGAPTIVSFAGMAYGLAGDETAARATIHLMESQSSHSFFSPFFYANVYFGMGDLENATLHLRQVDPTKVPIVSVTAASAPILEGYDSEPEVAEFLRKLKEPAKRSLADHEN